MSKKVNKLTEPNMRLYFLLAAVFCAVTLWIEPILGLVEAGVMALTYVYFRRTAQKRRRPEGRSGAAVARYSISILAAPSTSEQSPLCSDVFLCLRQKRRHPPAPLLLLSPQSLTALWGPH